jgi:REP element-mobilizing transposase RayT
MIDKMETLCHMRWECKYQVVFMPRVRRKVLSCGVETVS